VFHIQHQCETLANLLGRLAQGAATRRQRLEQRMAKARLKGQGNTLSSKLAKARKAETHALKLAKDVKTLVGWLERDILALAGLCFEARCELFNFIVTELEHREHLDSARIRPVRIALARQRDNLLGFAKVLDNKLEEIVQRFQVPDYQVRALCLLQRKPKTSQAYWMGRDQLNQQLAWKFHAVWGLLLMQWLKPTGAVPWSKTSMAACATTSSCAEISGRVIWICCASS
jgi:hypothetical protein